MGSSWGQYGDQTCVPCISSQIPNPWTTKEVLWLIFYLFIFNWRLIALQYWFDFRHTSTWICHRCTYVSSLLNLPPTSDLPPLYIVAEPQFEFPESQGNFPLAIYCNKGSVYASMLLSPFISSAPCVWSLKKGYLAVTVPSSLFLSTFSCPHVQTACFQDLLIILPWYV